MTDKERDKQLRELLEDVKEARQQSHFTHKAHNWLIGFQQRLEVMTHGN